MHLLLSLVWFACLMLAAGAIMLGNLLNAIILAAIGFAAAYASRTHGSVSAIDVHHRTEYHHHQHDPVHIEHDHRTRR